MNASMHHAMECARTWSTPDPDDRPSERRQVSTGAVFGPVDSGGTAASWLVTLTGSAFVKFTTESGSSVLVVHNNHPAGREVCFRLLSGRLGPAMETMVGLLGDPDMRTGNPQCEEWTASGDLRHADTMAVLTSLAAEAYSTCTQEPEFVQALLTWPSAGIPSITVSCGVGDMEVVPEIINEIAGIGPVHTLKASRTWHIVGDILGGGTPGGEGAEVDGATFDAEMEVIWETTDTVDLLRSLSTAPRESERPRGLQKKTSASR